MAEGIILENVLFIPTCNLISVSKMIDDSHFFFRFTDSLCAIQDQLSGSLIRAGEQIDGLYYTWLVPKVCAVADTGVFASKLWHRHLRNLSDNIVKLVSAISGSSNSTLLNKSCTVCPQAKQTRDSFPISDSKASCIFELIHCDLWGSYRTPSTCSAHYFLTIVDVC